MQMPPSNATLVAIWRQMCVTTEALGASRAGQVDGLSTGFFSSLQGRRVYVKPRQHGPGIAAREKICADLAADLEVPVPPVVLLDRPCAPGEERYCAASLVMFPQQMSWAQIDPATTGYPFPLIERMLNDLPEAGAKAIVFDTWVDQPDHNTAAGNHNIIAGTNDLAAGTGTIVLLDYQLALGAHGQWEGSMAGRVVLAALPNPLVRRADRRAVDNLLERLEALDDRKIEDVVTRIPTEYLSADDRETIIRGLLVRKPLVRAALNSVTGGQ